MAVACVAVVIASGGGAYAAGTLVTGRQVRDGTLSSADIRDGSLLAKDFKAGQLKAGPAGPAGPAGAPGPAGANGQNGQNGQNGADGAPPKPTLHGTLTATVSGGTSYVAPLYDATLPIKVTGAGSGSGSGTVQYGDLAMTKPTDATTAPLAKLATQGKSFTGVTVRLDRPGTSSPQAVYNLSEAFLSGVTSDDGTDSLGFTFGKIQVITYSADGSSSSYTYNAKTTEITTP